MIKRVRIQFNIFQFVIIPRWWWMGVLIEVKVFYGMIVRSWTSIYLDNCRISPQSVDGFMASLL